MPLPLGCRHVDVLLKEKLELIPLEMHFLRAGRKLGSFPLSQPQQHASSAPRGTRLHGALVPNCPKQRRASSYTEHSLPVCLIPTSMDHAVIPDLAPARPPLQRTCLRRGAASGRLADSRIRTLKGAVTVTLARSWHPDYTDFRLTDFGEKFYISEDNPKKTCNLIYSFKVCCVLTKYVSLGAKWRIRRRENGFLNGRTFYKPMHFDMFMHLFSTVSCFCNFYCDSRPLS